MCCCVRPRLPFPFPLLKSTPSRLAWLLLLRAPVAFSCFYRHSSSSSIHPSPLPGGSLLISKPRSPQPQPLSAGPLLFLRPCLHLHPQWTRERRQSPPRAALLGRSRLCLHTYQITFVVSLTLCIYHATKRPIIQKPTHPCPFPPNPHARAPPPPHPASLLPPLLRLPSTKGSNYHTRRPPRRMEQGGEAVDGGEKKKGASTPHATPPSQPASGPLGAGSRRLAGGGVGAARALYLYPGAALDGGGDGAESNE